MILVSLNLLQGVAPCPNCALGFFIVDVCFCSRLVVRAGFLAYHTNPRRSPCSIWLTGHPLFTNPLLSAVLKSKVISLDGWARESNPCTAYPVRSTAYTILSFLVENQFLPNCSKVISSQSSKHRRRKASRDLHPPIAEWEL